jgi:hypothetical protein
MGVDVGLLRPRLLLILSREMNPDPSSILARHHSFITGSRKSELKP